LGFFLVWWSGVFAGGFGRLWLQNVVFLWSFCGGMRGKDGQLMVTFYGLKIFLYFEFYFAD
jgi:hypothetical protein